MIFSFVGSWLKKLYDYSSFTEKLSFPLGHCHYCMVSVYGIAIHLMLLWVGYEGSFPMLPFILLMSAVLNGIFYGVLNKLDPALFHD